MPHVKRHVAKAISYRCLGTLQTIIIGYVLTGSIKLAGTAGVIEIVVKPVMYFLHERVWYHWVTFGLHPFQRSHDEDKK